jgi:MFS family permease
MTIETKRSWTVAFATLALLSVNFGFPLVLVVALKPIAADLGAARSVPALAAALASFGGGLGGIVMGRVAERVDMRLMVAFGAVMVGAGLAVSTLGSEWALYVGYGLMAGFLGNGTMAAPLMVYVSRWFDKRRGTALALISSGQYVAGTSWPSLFERGIEHWGWQATTLAFAALEVAVVLPIALIYLRTPPNAPPMGTAGGGPVPGALVLGLKPNLVLGLMTAAIFLCCVPMAQPSVHLVSFCTDLGFSAATGAGMLSVLLACAFISRQFWGWMGDRIGGLRSVLIGSACQTVTLALFLTTQDEMGLFAISAAFGLGFAGIVPNYVLAAREIFPASEATRRIPLMMFGGLLGMAVGGWMGGAVYDAFGSYAHSFALGVGANLLNLLVVGFLVSRGRRRTGGPMFAPAPASP